MTPGSASCLPAYGMGRSRLEIGPTRGMSCISITVHHILLNITPCRTAQSRDQSGLQRRVTRQTPAGPQQQHPWRPSPGQRALGWRACWRGRRVRWLASGSRHAALRQVNLVGVFLRLFGRQAGPGGGAGLCSAPCGAAQRSDSLLTAAACLALLLLPLQAATATMTA